MEDQQDGRLEETLLSTDDSDDNEGMDEMVVFDGEVPLLNPPATADSVYLQGAALFAFTVNFIFGAGVLGIPYAVAHGGIVASSILLVVSSWLSLCGMIWVLEVQERAKKILGVTTMVDYEMLVNMFIGPRTRRLYSVSLSVFCLCSSWMYASIFSVSLAKTLPIFSTEVKECDLSGHAGPLWTYDEKQCWGDYLVYLGIFCAMMTVLVRLDLGKMRNLQLALTLIGLFALVLMISTVLAAFTQDQLPPLNTQVKLFNASGFGTVFGTFVFAQLCAHGIPMLSTIPKKKSIIRPVFIGVISTTTVLYLALGILCAIFFAVDESLADRRPVNKLITLNWQRYYAGTTDGNAFSTMVSYYVRVYPAVTCAAAFPLYCKALGNSWYTIANGTPGDTSTNKSAYYIAAMLPSVLAAAAMADITFMLIFVGISAFVIAFFLPPMMQLNSLKQNPGTEVTIHSWHFSKSCYCYICISFAVIALTYTILSLFLH